MDGLPVVIRLIDPPLHEFLPNLEEQLVKVTRGRGDRRRDRARTSSSSPTIKSMHEQNPMLGLRGCRLGLMIPDFVKVQTRAILNALIAVKAVGRASEGQDHDPAGRARERADGDHATCSRPRRRPSRRRPASTSSTSSGR